ncbi:uncharacterized protein LOC143374132 isoform X2 [Andrena cerasifolii]|uniref:uncharacterized protein LOC143374132 isoform X2 n=1 Tax=Andrena cerasifolii TaxID=2819439 RepID=UPI004037A18B
MSFERIYLQDCCGQWASRASDCIMLIDDSFYKNVFLLMQAVPASIESVKYFRKGMFDKPNTAGFIHISHYLLSVHNAQRFRRMVAWPIVQKTDEKKYRTEIKAYLEILANNNLDMKFPPILASHLLQAGGTKFLIIMWKISEISLRAYIDRNYETKLLKAPNLGNSNDVTQKYFGNVNVKRDIVISELCGKIKRNSQSFENYMKNESNELVKLQTDIFEAKENMEKYVHVAPVNSLIVNRLTDPDDSEIIDLWRTSIYHSIKFLQQSNSNLKKLKWLSNSLCILVSHLCVNSKTFDGDHLPKVDTARVLLCLNNIQRIHDGLYTNDCLVFHTLLAAFNQILSQLQRSLKIHMLSDLSNSKAKITEYCETIKSMEETFRKRIEQVSDMSCCTESSFQGKSTRNCTMETDLLYSMSQKIFSASPKLDFSTDEWASDEKLLERLCFSPIQGKYKDLFKRHARKLFNSPEQSTAQFQLNNTMDNARWKSPRRQSLISKGTSPNLVPVSPRYSRLFSSSEFKRNHFKASTPNRSETNETTKKSNIKKPSTEALNIDAAMRNIFDLSCKITNVVTSLYKSE